MKRLLALLGLTCLAVLTACFYLGTDIAAVILITGLVLFACSMFVPFARKEGTYPVAFMTVAVAACIFIGYTNIFVLPLSRYDGKEAEVKAEQKDDVYFSNGYYHYVFKAKEINGEKVNANIKVFSKEVLYSEAFDEVSFCSELSYIDKGSYSSKKIFLISYVFDTSSVDITKTEDKPFMYHIINLRKSLSDSMYLEMDKENADFSNAVLLGNKHSLSNESTEMLRGAGISHIAVVSGMHLSIIAAVIHKFFRKITKNVYLTTALTIIGIVSFAFICGFSVPVIRASVMLIIFNVGILISRQSDSLNSLGAAVLVLVLYNPYSVGDVGMLLSICATMGIVLLSDKFTAPVMDKLSTLSVFANKRIYRLTKVIVSTFSVTLSATIATLPITMLTFGGFSTVSIVVNLLIVPFMVVVLVITGLCLITHFVPFLWFICDLFAAITSLFYDYLIFVCKTLTSLPYSYVHTDKPYFYFWLSASFILAAVAVLFNKRFVTIMSVLLSLLILFTGVMNYSIAFKSKLSVHIPYTGKGISLIVESNDGYAVLNAGGYVSKYYVLSNKIESMYSQKQNVLISTPGNNSNVFCNNLVNEFDYTEVLRYYNKYNNKYSMTADGQNVMSFSGVHTLSLWNKAVVTLIPADNDVFEYMRAGDTTVLVVPGSADCTLLPAEYTNADIVITDGIPYGYELLSCNTVYVTGAGYPAEAAQQVLTEISNKVIRAQNCSFDIELE